MAIPFLAQILLPESAQLQRPVCPVAGHRAVSAVTPATDRLGPAADFRPRLFDRGSRMRPRRPEFGLLLTIAS
jgi:hypothetical protein